MVASMASPAAVTWGIEHVRAGDAEGRAAGRSGRAVVDALHLDLRRRPRRARGSCGAGIAAALMGSFPNYDFLTASGLTVPPELWALLETRKPDYPRLMAAIPDVFVDHLGLAGTPAECAAQIERIVESGIRHVVLAPAARGRAARRIGHRAVRRARWCPGCAPPASSSSPEEREEPRHAERLAPCPVLLAFVLVLLLVPATGALAQARHKLTQAGFRVLYMAPAFVGAGEGALRSGGGRLHVHGARQRRARRGRRDLGQRADLRSRSPGRGEATAGRQAHPARLQPRRAGDAGPDRADAGRAAARPQPRDTPLAARYAALKGLTIGITRPGAPTDVFARYFLVRAGAQPRPRRDARPGRWRAGPGGGVQEPSASTRSSSRRRCRRRSSAKGRVAS